MYLRVRRKINNVTRKKISVITIVTATILAVAFSFSQFPDKDAFSKLKHAGAENVKGIQESTGDFVPLQPLSINSLSLPSIFHLRTQVLTWLLFKIFIFECRAENYAHKPSISSSLFVERIFSFCVSPNAP
jgi:hypothetical protein